MSHFQAQQLDIYYLENFIVDHSIDNSFHEMVINIIHHVYHRNQLMYISMRDYFASFSHSRNQIRETRIKWVFLCMQQ